MQSRDRTCEAEQCIPGDYTVRLTKAGKVYNTKLTVGVDRRAKFSPADRKAQFDAAMRVHALFGDESALMDRIIGFRSPWTIRPYHLYATKRS